MGVCYGTPDFPTPSFTGSLRSGRKLTITSSSSSAASSSHDLVAPRDNQAFGGGEVLADPNLTVFSFAELQEATKNFGRDTVIGEGGFGLVYKGMLHGNEQSGRTKTIVAVKILKQDSIQGYTEWRREIDFLGRLSHPNLVKLLGFCQEDQNLALVYEFMPMCSLEYQLFRKGSTAHLPWDVRLKIAIGAARDLAFLHSLERQIIVRDFKSSNILLDGSYTAKFGDFGLVKSCPPDGRAIISKRVMGTHGYADPVYVATGRLYVKSDVYSFGILLLEILTGLKAHDRSRPQGKIYLVDWVTPLLTSKKKMRTIMDSRLKGKYHTDCAFQIAQLALKCLQATPDRRPSMTEVVEELVSIEAASANRILRNA